MDRLDPLKPFENAFTSLFGFFFAAVFAWYVGFIVAMTVAAVFQGHFASYGCSLLAAPVSILILIPWFPWNLLLIPTYIGAFLLGVYTESLRIRLACLAVYLVLGAIMAVIVGNIAWC
ncbi:MAG: hypothetical protein FWD53_12910 [Phycisphaerales bacterium]|nr:hypothetical protein [Phycisphaerales bacterium]